MATKYEYNDSEDSHNSSRYGALWFGQTFTPQISHQITSFKFKILTQGLIQGLLYYVIYDVDQETHEPTDIICSGSVSPTDAPTETEDLYEISLGAGAPLTAGVEYAAILKYPDGDATHYFRVYYDASGSEYTRGRALLTEDGGSNWNVVGEPGADAVFEEWGTAGPPPMSRAYIAG